MISFSNQIAGMPVDATDGHIGKAVDVYFSPKTWQVLYLDVSTGWLFGQDVLVPATAIAELDVPNGPVKVNLSREAIKNSPPAEAAQQVDAAAEIVHAGGLAPADGAGGTAASAAARASLMSGTQLNGYRLVAEGADAGLVTDVIIDTERWRICSLIADIGGFFVPDMAEIGIGPVTGIDHESQVVHVAMPKAKVEAAERLREPEQPYAFPAAASFVRA
jgi:uncharacterized protein YrrD